MGLRVVGAGMGRTGTHSLKIALEQLTDAACYHMFEVVEHQEHIPLWQRATDGGDVDWEAIFAGYAAAVDWPAAAFWRKLAVAYPDAVILLSRRDSASWWNSAARTIIPIIQQEPPPELADWHRMVNMLMARRFTPDLHDKRAAIAAYERLNNDVLTNAPADRLVEWWMGDGWEPLCRALGVAVPDRPFPHVNTTAEFRAVTGLDPLAE